FLLREKLPDCIPAPEAAGNSDASIPAAAHRLRLQNTKAILRRILSLCYFLRYQRKNIFRSDRFMRPERLSELRSDDHPIIARPRFDPFVKAFLRQECLAVFSF